MRRSIGYLRENMEYGELRSTNNLIAAATVRSQPIPDSNFHVNHFSQ